MLEACNVEVCVCVCMASLIVVNQSTERHTAPCIQSRRYIISYLRACLRNCMSFSLIINSLTSYLHDVPRYDVFGLDPLHGLPVLSVDFPHLRLIFFKCLDGIFSVTLLSIFRGNKTQGTLTGRKKAVCIKPA